MPAGRAGPLMRVIVLGAAAGGGLPQWNCGCRNCNAARAGRLPRLTQSSLAVSADGASWALLNASPDLGQQLVVTPALHPRALRHSPIRSVLLTNADIDHVAGLLTLREKQPLTLWITAAVAELLEASPIFAALDPGRVARRVVALDEPFEPVPGLEATLFAAPGKLPLYMEGPEEQVETELEGGQTVGVALRGGGTRAVYLPGCARVTRPLAARLAKADAIFFDGTLWTDDEMVRLGLGAKTGRRMGHISMSGAEGSIAALADLRVRRKVFVHMNNSNPVLDPASPERREAVAAGWEIAHDGMELDL